MAIFKKLFSSPFERGLERAAADGNGIILDVRTREEYAAGHIPGAVNIPLDELEYTEIEGGKNYYVYCHSGARSGAACTLLAQDGYSAENIGGIEGYRGRLERG